MTKPIERAISRRPAAEPTSSRRRPTRSRWSSPSSRTARTSRRRGRRSSRTSRRSACPQGVTPQVNALNINQHAGDHRVDLGDGRRRARGGRPDRPDGHRAGAPGPRGRRRGRRDRRPRAAAAHHARPGEARRQRHLGPADQRRPRRQQPDPAGRPAAARTARTSPSRRPAGSARSTEIEDLVVGVKTADPADPAARRRARPRVERGAGRQRRPGRPVPVTIGDLGTVEQVGLADDRLRPDRRPAGRHDQRLEDLGREHGHGRRRRPGRARRAAQAGTPTSGSSPCTDLSSFIKESRDGLVREGGLGALFAILTIFLFLFSLRSTLVAAVSIPLSIFAALTLMQLTGISMNIMTLGGLAVAVGRVVDDAIVVLENIYRHRARGEDRLTAVLTGAREVSGAITASTATTVTVFLPLGFVGGLVSQFFLPFALTVTFALLASLLCALTVVPGPGLLPRRPGQGWTSTRTASRGARSGSGSTRPTITCALRSRLTQWGVVGVAGALFVASLAARPVRSRPSSSTPAARRSCPVSIQPPPGTSSTGVLERTIEAEPILDAEPAGRAHPVDRPGRGRHEHARRSRPRSPAGRRTARRSSSGSTRRSTSRRRSEQIADRPRPARDRRLGRRGLRGQRLLRRRDQRHRQLVRSGGGRQRSARPSSPRSRRTPTSSTSRATWPQARADRRGHGRSEQGARGRPDDRPGRRRAAQRARARAGRPGSRSATSRRVDLYVQVDPASVDSVDALRDLPGRDRPDRSARPDRDGREGRRPGQHHPDRRAARRRRSRPRSPATIPARCRWPSQAAIDRLKADGTIPPNVEVTLAGVTQQQNEAFGGLFASMGVAILLVYVMLVLTFNSLVTPFVILFSLPLALDRRVRGPLPDRSSDRDQRADRLPDADRDRRHQCDRPARPRRAAAVAGQDRPTTPSSRAAGPASGRSS